MKQFEIGSLASTSFIHSVMYSIEYLLLYLFAVSYVLMRDYHLKESDSGGILSRRTQDDSSFIDGLFHTFHTDGPFIADTSAYYNGTLTLYVVFNALHLRKNCSFLGIGDYVLHYSTGFYYGKRIPNADCGVRVIKYAFIPNDMLVVGQRITFSITNEEANQFFLNCSVTVRGYKQKKGIATCTYLSDVNSFYEVAHFIQYTLSIGVNRVNLYQSAPLQYVGALKHLYGSKVQVYNWTWPRTRSRGPIQNSNQSPMYDGCYYRHKETYKYIFNNDLDELIVYHGSSLMATLDELFASAKTEGLKVGLLFRK